MLRSIKHLYRSKLGATDGDIGHVQDFYFDDQNWVVRYVIVDAGSWLPGRQVLISPHAVRSLDVSEKILQVNLTRLQIENSPLIETHKPVSRQYEEDHYKYDGWPNYWQGGGLWGVSGFPVYELPLTPIPEEPATQPSSPRDGADAHLRSTKAVNGYQIKASDGTAGHVCDFMIDVQSWAIRQLVVKTGHRLTGREVQVPASNVSRISYEESLIFVNMTIDAVEQSPPYPLDSDATAMISAKTHQ